MKKVDPLHLQKFCERYQIEKLSLFGSVVRGDERADSDVDILVEFSAGKTPGLLLFARMQRELTEMYERKVDLRTPNELSRYFRDAVLATAKVQFAQG